MAKFAVIDGNKVLNTIVADSKEIAEQVTGYTCIEFTSEPAEPNGFYNGIEFIYHQPFPSWVLNSNNIWEAPIPKPDAGEDWKWDEESLAWIEIEVPTL